MVGEPHLAKVREMPGHVRDRRNRAILCTDKNALTAYKTQRARMRAVDRLRDEITEIKETQANILSILKTLLAQQPK